MLECRKRPSAATRHNDTPLEGDPGLQFMAGTSELKAAQEAPKDDTASGPDPAASGSAITAFVALAARVGANPETVADLGSECRSRVRAACANLRQSGRSRFLPLLTELERTLDALAAPPGANACAAIASALDLLAEALIAPAPPPRSREMIAIAELRSVRGAPAPWRSPLIEFTSRTPGAAAVAAGFSAEPHPEIIRRTLAAFRRSLLRFLKSDSAEEARRLSELSLRVAKACGEEMERRRWYAAGAMFACASESVDTPRPLVKRLAVKLEQALRGLSEDSEVNERSRCALILDLEMLSALLRRNSGRRDGDEEPELPFRADPTALESAFERLADMPLTPRELLAQVADAFLVDGKYDCWLEARQLGERPEPTESLRAAVTRWKTLMADGSGITPGSGASTHFAQAQAALRRIEGALEPGNGVGDRQVRISGIPVDEALLEHLDLMAREIRGARSRAEANLGSLRGGLADMERTIRTLRSQLESLEVDAHAGAPSATESGASVQSKFDALSRGIEELAGLKDALQSLTEETESALAAQAGEDAELEHGLLKTRMMPVGAQFEALCQRVQLTASRCGVAATLSARGAEVALERSQADALTRALDLLLEACVREGLSTSVSPAGTESVAKRIELDVSQPRFDVRVDISYRGAPLSPAALAAVAPAMDALGAVIESSSDGDGLARLNLLIPAPPQPMDLLLVEVGGDRFALPLMDVSGVSRAPEPVAAAEGESGYLKVEDKFYLLVSLAEALDLEPTYAGGPTCVLFARGGSLLALRVDAVIGRERMLVRSPGPLLRSNPWVLAVVVEALAAPTLVLDLEPLETRKASGWA
ncbi:MAG TPA: chemotaxis protein CheW [Gammaproteobacteria bacterium]|nr:chemotaxis protein CheW [Gammaproteobacteria bacterium]